MKILRSCAGGRHNMPPPLQVDLGPFDLESGVRVTCDVGYLCANFSLPKPICSRLRPDVRDRQTSDAHHRLMPRYGGGGIIIQAGRC